ncbi:serine hydrolase [Alteribacter natronophilus]|nr:serine hydrolase [Alteribacter natronophilus]
MAKKEGKTLVDKAFGFADRANQRVNSTDTRFGIASGCKLFTAIAVCQLVEKGKLSFDTRLADCLDYSFPNFHPHVTVKHLLTHTSGVPDYFDEEEMDDFEDLWRSWPMYRIRTGEDFLPLFQNGAMMFQPGERFHYNNAGYILLGLIVEALSGRRFDDYVETEIFKPCGMEMSGYFSFDSLPGNTAIGYIEDDDGRWRTNHYSLPVKGGADGGAYVTAGDMMKLWDGLAEHRLLGEEMTRTIITPQVETGEGDYYGYGIWIGERRGKIGIFHVMGFDPGVSFASAWYPNDDFKAVITSNKSEGPHDVLRVLEEELRLK